MARFERIEEVLKLVSETGDRCVVMAEGVDPFVVMNLPQYRQLIAQAAQKENLTQLTEDELLDRINRDIAEWRSAQNTAFQDFDLSQFRVDAPMRTQGGNPGLRPQPSLQELSPKIANVPGQRMPEYTSTGPDLPVVADKDQTEYKLEPLS